MQLSASFTMREAINAEFLWQWNVLFWTGQSNISPSANNNILLVDFVDYNKHDCQYARTACVLIGDVIRCHDTQTPSPIRWSKCVRLSADSMGTNLVGISEILGKIGIWMQSLLGEEKQNKAEMFSCYCACATKRMSRNHAWHIQSLMTWLHVK